MTTINTARPVTRPVAAWRDQLPTLIRVYGIILTLVLLVAVVGIGNPAFLSSQNIFNMLSQWAPAGIMAVGMTFVILTGGFDLSVASDYSLCAVVAAYVGQSYPPSIAFAAAIVVGLLFGLINGLLVAVVRINPFITTVGSGFVINGVALVMTKNAAFLVDNPDFGTLGAGRWHGVPYSGMLLIVFLLVFGFILARTVYGEAIYSVGGNYEASRLSGIRVRTVVASTYVVLGGCIGLAGSIIASQLSFSAGQPRPRHHFRRAHHRGGRRHVAVGRRRRDVAHGRRARNYCDDLERLRAARYQSVLSVDHQGHDHRCGAGARRRSDPPGARQMKNT